MADLKKRIERLLSEEPKPLRAFKATFYYKSGKTKEQMFITYDLKIAKKQAEFFVQNGFAHIDGDELVKGHIEEDTNEDNA